MADAADLLASITAAPADDLPRLVYADWLEEHGEGDYAQFIRDQIRLSQVPAWDPFAIRSRHQLHDTLTLGKPFRSWLPELPPFMAWPTDQPFHRGFGTKVVVNQLSGLLEAGEELFDLAPVDELWLSAATLDQWRALARSPWLKNVRKLHFHFSQGLYEPIRCLAESQYSGNIDEIWFDTLATPAAGTVIEAVAESKLAEQLAGLHMRLVHVPSVPEIIDALSSRPYGKLERISMVQAGFEFEQINSLCNIPAKSHIQQFDLSENNIHTGYLEKLLQFQNLNTLIINSNFENNRYLFEDCFSDPSTATRGKKKQNNCKINSFSLAKCFDGNFDDNMRLLLDRSQSCHCLNIESSRFKGGHLSDLHTSKIWPTLRELNLAGNSLTNEAIQKLCRRETPVELIAISFTRSCLSERSAKRLEAHFGEALVWSGEQAATGLAR